MDTIRLILGTMLLLTISTSALAQTWSPQQQEVWNAVKEMSDRFTKGDMDSAYEFVHPDLVWWNSGNEFPGNYEAARRLDTAYYSQARPFLARDCVPLTIQAYDTFAVVNSYCRGFRAQDEGEDPEWTTVRLHFVMKKEGSRWMQVANYIQNE